ncbi:MAG: anhydro-N-acetylmuramic acid kinase [Rhodobacter sp.]|nr:anhydro-N-acetylmuramic acid kinase [Rhodobacter sp.]
MKITGPVWALGAMSGTSMDGVDAALLRTDGIEISAFGESGYRAFSAAERDVLRAAQGRWPGEAGVEAAAEVIEIAHAELLSRFTADLVGFHGQTLAHEPDGRGTHQAGSGEVLAEVLDLPVVWDFRSADVELGGQGAPLAPFFHFACARWIGAREPLVFLNLGGVGNLTWVDPGCRAPESDGACLAFDTGPANAPLDDLMQARRGTACDLGGELAASGQPDADLVAQFLTDGYFLKMPPKSLDRNSFAQLPGLVAGLGDADAAATLVAVAVASVARGLEHCPATPSRLLVSGGGRKNPAMMAGLRRALDFPVDAVEAVGLDGDMLEAQAFAYLAVRVMRGLATSAPGTTGVSATVGGGRIARPGPARIG